MNIHNEHEKILGILGGVGTLATAFFVTKLAKRTDARTDQEHVTYICLNHAKVPDRTAWLIGESKEDPRPVIADGLRFLQEAGADVIAIPCNTSHCFFDDLQSRVEVPVINMAESAVRRITGNDPDARAVGILATTGTVTTGLYQGIAAAQGLEAIIPDEADQALLMKIIYDDVKSGNEADADTAGFLAVADRLLARGADALIVACTELSVLCDLNYGLFGGRKLVDAMDVLVEESIIKSGKKLKIAP
ncbi:MAG: amino acid racemase [Clostridiales Family XIII bacterium]|jgi:aspartate racemase|nr:amino acid racemase [Clostridiales Family XIII bacterium]